MKKRLLLPLFMLMYGFAFCQPAVYWQQSVNYKIDVSLNDTLKTLDGYERIAYKNNSPDTLRFIWFHIWPNAYKNDRTAFSDQLLENGKKDFYFSDEAKRGYINRLDFKVDKITAIAEDHPAHQDIIKLWLPKPLPPGAVANIETPFHVKLPYNFSRGGYIGNSFQITQWYPKPAVYDRKGWHEMPYLDQGEFYAEFGEYDVQVTVPKAYSLAATGKMNNEENNGDTKTLHFIQKNVHDFAWFADKDFETLHDTLQLATHIVDVYAYFNKNNAGKWQGSIAAIKAAIKTKSDWVGEYPYDLVSVVEKTGKDDGGGMEYPTITLVSSASTDLINHEVGHNWFYGILASNERQHPWMDEGMNTYYDNRFSALTPDTLTKKTSAFIRNRLPENFMSILVATMTATNKDQPIETAAPDFSAINYEAIAYGKTAAWMKLLETRLGKKLFDSAMHAYFIAWQFKHPYPEDFRKIIEETSGQNVDDLFLLLTKKGPLSPVKKKGARARFVFSLKETEKYQHFFALPAIGYNNYDKLMVGLLLHNYSLPPSRLKFIVAPLYATGSKQFNGIGNLNFTTYFNKKISSVVVGLTAARFSTKQSVDTLGKKKFENFSKVVPSVQLYFRQKPRSQVTCWLDLRSFLINEQSFDPNSFVRKAVVDSTSDSLVSYPLSTLKNNRYVNEVSFNIENDRILYPYKYQLKFQQGRNFYRVDLNTNYFFNYAKGGGLAVRLFASKFRYLGKDRNAYIYQPKLLAATGEDDYTFSNYFIGRSASSANAVTPVENHGLAGHQVMIRDGGLKLRLDQFDYLQGRSDNWAAAINFNTSLPDFFPVKLPLKLFLDIGTNAETWKDNSTVSRFLYVGGLQLSLFKNLLNIYAPVVYSKDFKTVLKSQPEQNSFFKRITFSIDVQRFSFKKLIPQLPL